MKSKILSVAAAALMFAACNEPLNEAAELEELCTHWDCWSYGYYSNK